LVEGFSNVVRNFRLGEVAEGVQELLSAEGGGREGACVQDVIADSQSGSLFIKKGRGVVSR